MPKATAIATIDSLRRPVKMEHDKEQPLSTTLFVFTGHERRHNSHVDMSAVGEGVVGAVALVPLAELTRAALFAADGAGQNRGLLLGIQVAQDRA